MQAALPSEGSSVEKWLAKRGIAPTLACAVAFLAFIPTLSFQFIYDDKPQIIENPAIHAWHYLPGYFTSHAWAELYPHVSGNYYRPLFLLWFRLNHALFGLDPKGWHLTTILCHVVATYLVFALIRRLAADRLIAFAAAILFALHPIHIESVAWVSGVTDPLMAIFVVGSFLAYLRFHKGGQWIWMALSLVLFALGLLEKETSVILGPLIFIYEWLYEEQRGWPTRFAHSLKRSAGFFVLTLLYLPIRAHVLRGLSHSVTYLSWGTLLLTEPSVLWLYFRHLLFPVGLSGLYGLPYVRHAAWGAFFVPTLLLLVTILLAGWGIRRLKDPCLAVLACCWIVLPIIPVLWLRAYAEGDIAHDRYLYVPSIGFVLLISLVLAELLRHWRAHYQTLQLGFVLVIAAAYTLGTMTEQMHWASDLLLYERAYRIAPRDNLICNNLGTALMGAGNSGGAVALYSQVLDREPGFWLSNYNLGYTYYKLGRFQEAEHYLRRAISINAADSDEFMYLGLALWREGRTGEAVPYIQQAIAIRPAAPGYHFALAMIRREQNNIPAAESEFNLELQHHPESTAARQQLEVLSRGVASPSK